MHSLPRWLALAATLLAGTAGAAEPIVIKFSHVVAADTPKGQAAEKFKQLAEQRTGGRIRVEVYPNGQLFKDKDELQALQKGEVQMLAPSTGKFAPLGFPEFDALDLPYLFSSEAALHKVTAGPIGQGLLRKLESKGMVGLAFWDNGFRVLSANRPLRVPADVKGLTMRINSSGVNQAIVRSVGAGPRPLPLSEVYPALQRGVVDGMDGNISNFFTQKHHEVQKYLVDTRHSYSAYVVVVNKRFWDDMPQDLRATLASVMKDATAFNNVVASKDAFDAWRGIKASGKTVIHVPTQAERTMWMAAMAPVQDALAPRVGKELLQAIRMEVAGAPQK